MSPRRRAVLLAGLALVLGGLAAADVSGREQALRRQIGDPVDVVVTRGPVPAGARLDAARLAVRRTPSAYAPAGAYAAPGEVAGARAAVALPAGADITPALLDGASDGPVLRPGERAADLIASGSAALVRAGGRVDVAVTRDGPDGRPGRTDLALRGAEVLAARAAPGDDGGARVAVTLRVTLAQALLLAQAESFARSVRVLPVGGRR